MEMVCSCSIHRKSVGTIAHSRFVVLPWKAFGGGFCPCRRLCFSMLSCNDSPRGFTSRGSHLFLDHLASPVFVQFPRFLFLFVAPSLLLFFDLLYVISATHVPLLFQLERPPALHLRHSASPYYTPAMFPFHCRYTYL